MRHYATSSMNIRLRSAIAALVLALTTDAKPAQADGQTPFAHKLIFENQQHPVYVAIANSTEQRELGLMFRRELGPNQGMLFVYADQRPRSMWMKNTLIALDVLFVSADARIAAFLTNLPPCRKDPCRIYDSQIPAQYMLELPAGFIDRHAIGIGQKLVLPDGLATAEMD